MSVFPKEVRRNDHAGKYYSFLHQIQRKSEDGDQIQENLLKAEDQEAWIENLKNKSRMMRRLYIENEALLNLYIRPFLDGEASLNEELAREFLHQIRMADDEGYEDNLAMLEILELLDGYFQKSDDLDSYIWTLNLLGNFL